MNLNQFLHAIRSSDINASFGEIVKVKYEGEKVDDIYNNQALVPDNIIFKKWIIGGVCGGSCWGNENRLNRESEKEPEFENLDKILTGICPGISFLQYKKLMKLVKSTENTETEYYGNYNNYRIEYIVLEDLYNALVEMKII